MKNLDIFDVNNVSEKSECEVRKQLLSICNTKRVSVIEILIKYENGADSI